MQELLLSTIIVDDEKFSNANLSNLITTYCPVIKIIDTANNAALAIQKINSLKPDVVFLDVNMPQQTGFDVLNKLTHTPLIVFVTAHEKHALRAMKVCAVDFLLKPIDINELILTEKKLLQIHSIKPEIKENYNLVLRNLSDMIDKPNVAKKITLPGARGYEIIDMSDILYLVGENNYTTFYFINRKEIVVTKTLKDYEEILESFGFIRIHKSTLINLLHIKKIVQNENVDVEMSDGKILNVSRRRTQELLEWSKLHIK